MAYTLNRRLAQLVDSNGQLNTGKIPNDYITSDHVADNSITSAMLHTSFTVSTSNLTAIDTDDVSEGSSNLYFTNARVDTEIDSYLSGGTGVTYSSGAISIGQDVGTTATPTFGNITTTGYIAGPATFTIDPAAVGDNTGTVVIAGNLQVDGTTTTINSTTVNVDDLNIQLATGAANAAAADGAGITVDGASATITYDGTNDEWDFNKDINVTGSITTGQSMSINNSQVGVIQQAHGITSGNTVANKFQIGRWKGTTFDKWMLVPVDDGTAQYSNEFGYNFSTSAWFFDSLVNFSGNVGIGETSPLGKLHIKSADSSASADGSADELVIEGSGDSGLSILSGASNYGTILFSDSGDSAAGRIRYEHDNNALNFGTNGAWDKFYINSSGNVGIGTNDIGTNSKLDVFGGAVQIINNAASFEGSTADATLHIKGAEPTQNRLTQMSAEGTSQKAVNLIASTDATGGHQWWSWGVDTDDQFKILHGTTINTALSGIRIQNTGNLIMGNSLYFNNATDSSSITNSSGSLYLNSDNSMYLRTYDGSWQTRLTILDGGNVGIGTSPSHRLHVNSGTDTTVAQFASALGGAGNVAIVKITASGNSSNGLRFIQCGSTSIVDGGANAATVENTENAPLIFGTNNTEAMRIDASGDVGIGGISNPLKLLHLQRTAPTSVGTPDADTMLLLDHDGDQYIEFRTTGTNTGIMQGNLFTDNGVTAFIGYKQYAGAGVGDYGESIHIGLRDFSSSDQYTGIYLGNTTADVAEGISSPHMFIKSGSGNVGIGTTVPARKLVIATDTAGDGANLLLVNKNDTDGDEASIGFSMLENNTYVKGGIAFERTTTAGRGSLHFALNNSTGSDNVVYGTDDVLKLDADAKNAWFYGNVNMPGDKSLYFHTDTSSAYEARLYLSDYPSQGYTASGSGYTSSLRYWPTLESAGGAFIVLNTDGGAGSAENAFDSFVVWQGNRDGDKLFKVSNAGNTSTRRLTLNSAGSETTFIPNGSGLDRVDLMVRSYTSGEKHGQVIACDNNGEAHLYMVDTANGSGGASIGASSGGWGLDIYYDGLADPYNLRTGFNGTWTKREEITFTGERKFMNSNLQHNDAGKSVQWTWFTTPSHFYAATTTTTATNFNVNGGWTDANGNSLPSNVKAIYVTYYYHIGGYSTGSVGQGDHASDLWGPTAPSNSPISWSFTSSGNAQWGSAVFMHDGDASENGDMLYYGAWYPGAIIAVNSNNNIYGLLGHGHSGGTHYHHMYCWGYAT
jgi:hypothetical protein